MEIPRELREEVKLAISETGLLGSIGSFSSIADVAAIAGWWGYLLVKYAKYYVGKSIDKEAAKKICSTAILGMGGYYAGCKAATRLFHMIPGAGTLIACGVSGVTNMVFTYRFAVTLTKIFTAGKVDFNTLAKSIPVIFAGTGNGVLNLKDIVCLYTAA